MSILHGSCQSCTEKSNRGDVIIDGFYKNDATATVVAVHAPSVLPFE